MILAADLFRYLFSTGGVVVVFLVIAVWISAATRRLRRDSASIRWARHAMLLSALTFTAFSIYGLQYLLARVIVGPLQPLRASQVDARKRTAVVVLGSGSWHARDWDGRSVTYPDPASANRELEAARVFKLVNPVMVVSSGGNPYPDYPAVPVGEAMREHLIALGVPTDKILVETESKTTRDEAVVVERMLKAQAIDQVILVTSETHMRRSLTVFRSVGIDPIPAIALEFLREEATWGRLLMPSDLGLSLGSRNVHEILGAMYYGIRGWHR